MNAAALPAAAEGLEPYLHRVIPLSRAMEVRVIEVSDERAILCAPLEPNMNHLGTVFGGSACTLGTLAAWTLLHSRLSRRQSPSSLLLQSSAMIYHRPMTGEFRAQAQLTPGADWDLFLRTLERRGRARVGTVARLLVGEAVAAEFSGEFVALSEAPQRRL